MANEKEEKWFDIFQAANELQLSAAYIRLQVRNGVIKSKQVSVHEGSSVLKHIISESELKRFVNRDYARAPRRSDGRGKVCFYAHPNEIDRIKELLYATHDEGLAVVAQSIVSNSKGGSDVHWTPPSKSKSGREQS